MKESLAKAKTVVDFGIQLRALLARGDSYNDVFDQVFRLADGVKGERRLIPGNSVPPCDSIDAHAPILRQMHTVMRLSFSSSGRSKSITLYAETSQSI